MGLPDTRKEIEKKKKFLTYFQKAWLYKAEMGRGRINPHNQNRLSFTGCLHSRPEYPLKIEQEPQDVTEDLTQDWRTRGRRWKQLHTIKL